MTLDDLTPTVYDRWPNARLNTSTWPLNHALPDPSAWRNETSVDSIFDWGERYGRTRRPIFAKVPIPYSTLFNTAPKAGMDSTYIPGTSPPKQFHVVLNESTFNPELFDRIPYQHNWWISDFPLQRWE